MNNKISDTTKRIIEQNSELLGSEVIHQLKQARLKALDESNIEQKLFFRAWFIPATAAMALAFYFMVPLLTVENQNQGVETQNYVDVNDIEMIEQMELVKNLEFYEWLSQEKEMSSI